MWRRRWWCAADFKPSLNTFLYNTLSNLSRSTAFIFYFRSESLRRTVVIVIVIHTIVNSKCGARARSRSHSRSLVLLQNYIEYTLYNIIYLNEWCAVDASGTLFSSVNVYSLCAVVLCGSIQHLKITYSKLSNRNRNSSTHSLTLLIGLEGGRDFCFTQFISASVTYSHLNFYHLFAFPQKSNYIYYIYYKIVFSLLSLRFLTSTEKESYVHQFIGKYNKE